MAQYPNPIGKPNPFFTKQPVVYAVRHVRVTSNNEIVVENANNLPRQLYRIVSYKAYPQRTQRPPEQRNIPENNHKLGEY